VNTVGSGDLFIAGCETEASWRCTAQDVFKLATAGGSANTQDEQREYVECQKVDEYFEKAEVNKI